MSLQCIFDKLDVFLNRWFGIDQQPEKEHYDCRAQVADKVREAILHDANIIDNKSSALLTHISVMFVVLGLFLADTATAHWSVTGALLVELIIYLAIAMILLRCIDIMGPPFRQLPAGSAEKTLEIEVKLRREIYQRSVRMVFLLTALLIPIVFIKYSIELSQSARAAGCCPAPNAPDLSKNRSAVTGPGVPVTP